jgi:hypothetical protein
MVMAEKNVIENVGSKEYVALELTRHIASKEELWDKAKDFRKEYLDLYTECLKAATIGYRNL